MKKKMRRELRDCYQIGNYVYAGSGGRIVVVVGRNERVRDEKIANDIDYLLKFYGVDYANFYMETIQEYINSR